MAVMAYDDIHSLRLSIRAQALRSLLQSVEVVLVVHRFVGRVEKQL